MPEQAERKALSEGLAELNENMTTLAQLAQLAIRKAVDSLEKLDSQEADQVFTIDQEVYGLKQQIFTSCIDLIALHAPVARDLRTITASLEITTDLDRIGRYSKDIAELIQLLKVEPPGSLRKFPSLVKMGELTIGMINTALDAFLHRDVEPVRGIVRADDAVDDLHDAVFQEIVDQIQSKGLSARVGAQYILINRYFERLADHAVNIGEHVTFMVTGQRPSRVKRPSSDVTIRGK